MYKEMEGQIGLPQKNKQIKQRTPPQKQIKSGQTYFLYLSWLTVKSFPSLSFLFFSIVMHLIRVSVTAGEGVQPPGLPECLLCVPA